MFLSFLAKDIGFMFTKLFFQVDLNQPDFCEKEIWELVEECWCRDEKSRPTFAEISLFLKRKTISYENEK